MQDSKTPLRIARILITSAALLMILLPLSQEIGAAYLINPYWPPHARFHEAWLMGLVSLNGLIMLYLLWGIKQHPIFCVQLASLIGLVIIVTYAGACLMSPYYGGTFTYTGKTAPSLLTVIKTLWLLLGASACLLGGFALTSALKRWDSLATGVGKESPSL